MIDYETFFSLVDIDSGEIDAAKEYIQLRGLQEHILMANYLSSFIIDRKPTYKEVSTAFRYDKRIRRIIYKYIGLIEEYFRAFLCNNYKEPSDLNINTSKTLYDYLSSILLSTLTRIIWSLNQNDKNQIFDSKTILNKNLEALVSLRNAVSHNRTLIIYRDFKEVTLFNGEVGSSLLLNVKNLLYLLPTKVSMSFKEEIKGATRQGGRKRNNQVEWSLLPAIVLKLD